MRKNLAIYDQDFSDYAKLSKEYSDLKLLVNKIEVYKKLNEELQGVLEILDSDDEDMKEAVEEKINLALK